MRPFLLFHWSPVSRRKSIERRGLVPWSASRCGDGAAYPWLCFARSPSLAWALSAIHSGRRGAWDLWMVWSVHVPGWQTVAFHASERDKAAYPWPKEYRTRDRIPMRKLWRVGTREFVPRKQKR